MTALLPASAFADAAPPDFTPPKVSIKAPKSGVELPAGPQKITVKVKARDRQSGVFEVELMLDGQSVGVDEDPPWEFVDVELGPGRHELIATALNDHLEKGESKPVVVVVAEPEPEPEPEPAPEPATDTDTDADKNADAKTDAKAETKADAKADIKADIKANPTPAKPEAAPTESKDTQRGCFASVRRTHSLFGSGVALLFAAFAGLMLRRRR